MSEYTSSLRIPHDHPCLAGHFPGRPIVPGVVLLDEVIAAAESWLGRALRVRVLQQAKFSQPLLPEEPAQLSLTMQDATLRFTITRDGQKIAQGAMSIEASP